MSVPGTSEKGNCDLGSGGVHRGTPARHRGQGKCSRKGSAGPHRGRIRRHRGLGKRSAGQHQQAQGPGKPHWVRW